MEDNRERSCAARTMRAGACGNRVKRNASAASLVPRSAFAFPELRFALHHTRNPACLRVCVADTLAARRYPLPPLQSPLPLSSSSFSNFWLKECADSVAARFRRSAGFPFPSGDLQRVSNFKTWPAEWRRRITGQWVQFAGIHTRPHRGKALRKPSS
jgi:hypothetical protein